jgi:hypothetical protein
MGCSGSHYSLLDYTQTPLDNRIKKIGVGTIDEEFSKGRSKITELEALRTLIIDNRDIVILKSGGYCYTNIDMKAIIHSFVLVLSVYLKGELNQVRRHITNNYPFIDIDCSFNTKADKLYRCFMIYQKDLKTAEEALAQFVEPYRAYVKSVLTNKQLYIEQCTKAFGNDRAKL